MGDGAGSPRAPSYAANYAPSASGVRQLRGGGGPPLQRPLRGQLIAGVKPFRLPRVSFWSIWNEPNQPGWLAPQWRRVAGRRVPDRPRLYRALRRRGLRGAGGAPATAGDRHDPDRRARAGGLLAGPAGTVSVPPAEQPIPPIPFLHALYCVDAGYQPLTGALAVALHCPPDGAVAARSCAAHPACSRPPGSPTTRTRSSWPRNVAEPIRTSSRCPTCRGWSGRSTTSSAPTGSHRQLPIYLTEYGYETNPPEPVPRRPLGPAGGVPRRGRVHGLEGPPRAGRCRSSCCSTRAPNTPYPRGSSGYWSTFQTGLVFLDGRAKPSLRRLPAADLPARPSGRGRGHAVGLGDAAAGAERRRASGADPVAPERRPVSRTLATVDDRQPGRLLRAVRDASAGSGALRIAWASPGGRVFYSRAAPVLTKRG